MALWQTDRFRDRIDAAEQLADALSSLRDKHPLILAIPRGGVPIGRVLADRLQGELDVVLVRKLGAPGHPEYAVGAIDENGRVQVSQEAELVGASEHYLQQEAAAQLATIRARRQLYSPHHAAIDPAILDEVGMGGGGGHWAWSMGLWFGRSEPCRTGG